MKPDRRRRVVDDVRATWRVSIRRACSTAPNAKCEFAAELEARYPLHFTAFSPFAGGEPRFPVQRAVHLGGWAMQSRCGFVASSKFTPHRLCAHPSPNGATACQLGTLSGVIRTTHGRSEKCFQADLPWCKAPHRWALAKT